jgi:hypothetical protein
VYTESLFLALSLGAVYAARRQRWLLASALAALATLSRVPGILVLAPVAWMLLRSPGRSWRRAALLLAAPAALLGFLGYMASRGFGWLAPLHNQLGAEHAHVMTGPFVTLGFAVSAAWKGLRSTLHGSPIFSPTFIGPFPPAFESVILLAVLLLAVVVLVLAFRRLPAVYGVYALITLIVCIFSPVSDQPLQGLDRYLLTIFPLWMAAGAWLAKRQLRWPVLGLGAGLLFFYSFEFATWAFIG